MKKIIILSALLIFSGCNRNRPLLTSTPASEISDNLDKRIPELMEKTNVMGMSVVIIRNGKISIKKSFGYADVGSGRKIDDQTIFRAASLGKPVFAYIVISLARQGKIDLDVPLYSYFQEEVVQGDTRSRIITARMVLTHTTGLPNFGEKNSTVEFLFAPGTDFQYSGHAYLYLQRVIEKRTGKSLNKLANELVFDPLNMTASSFIWQDKYRGTIAESYDENGKAFHSKEEPVTEYSAWSLFTTVEDYARFISYTIETSNVQGSIAKEMLVPYVNVAQKVQWGHGWGLQETVPHRSFWHWGSMAGFRHYVVAYPEEKTAVIVMTNSSTAFQVVEEVMVTAIGGTYPSYEWL